jgi:spore maturation protein CgeB
MEGTAPPGAPQGPLRVLLVPPLYGGSLPVARFCGRALAGMGHMVETFEAPDFHGAFTALKGLRVTSARLTHLENAFLGVVSQAILAKVETFEPDLVLALAQAPLGAQALRRLRRDGVLTAMWFVEDWRVFTYWRAYAPLYDFFAVIQEDPFLGELAAAGQPNAFYLPLAADPQFHRPLDLTPGERRTWGAEVGFMGAGYPNRRTAFRRLLHHDFKIWGTEWDGDAALARRVQMRGRRVSPEECVKIFNATLVNLNLHSSVQGGDPVPRGDFVNRALSSWPPAAPSSLWTGAGSWTTCSGPTNWRPSRPWRSWRSASAISWPTLRSGWNTPAGAGRGCWPSTPTPIA